MTTAPSKNCRSFSLKVILLKIISQLVILSKGHNVISFYPIILSKCIFNIKSFWQVILTSHFDKSFWQVILTSHFDKSFWQVILTSHFDTSFWHIILTSHFDKSFWIDNHMKGGGHEYWKLKQTKLSEVIKLSWWLHH